MVNTIVNSFDIWSSAQGIKSRTRVKSVDNISLEGMAGLRQLILELAVRGKLVSQNLNDEPIEQLLKRVEIENKLLIEKGELRKPKVLPKIENHEYPFSLPKGWEYIRLNNIGEWGSGSTPNRGKSEYYGGNIPWFKSGELVGDYISTAEEFITELALKETSLRYNKVGDVLIAMYGATIGKTSVLTIPATTNQAVCACTPFRSISNIFLLTLLKAYKSRFIDMGAGGAQPNISREKIIATVIALPPLAEQHRIVAKVDELMAVCDKLEAEQFDNLKTHQVLVKTLLETLIQAADANELQAAWERMSAHFDTLFCTEDSIDQLKQTILKLAIIGKLVKQDPNDEPASELVKKIAKEKERLIEGGKIRKQAVLSEIREDEKPFSLPERWEWCRLGSITDIIAGMSFNSGDFNTSAGTKCIKITNAGVGAFVETNDYLPESFAKRYSDHLVKEGDLILALTRPYISEGLKISICPTSYDNSLLNQRVAAIRLMTLPLFHSYVYIFIQSPHVLNLYKSKFYDKSQQPNMKMSDITDLVFALPPLKEQHRIVEKIDELFGLCDAIKKKINNSQELKVLLSKTIVEKAVQ